MFGAKCTHISFIPWSGFGRIVAVRDARGKLGRQCVLFEGTNFVLKRMNCVLKMMHLALQLV